MIEKEEEIDLFLATANYKEDLSSYFKNKKQISKIISLNKDTHSLLEDNDSIYEYLEEKDFFEIFCQNLLLINENLKTLYIHRLKFDSYSKNDCYIQFKSSTGGKESEDLAFIMFKNYLKMFLDNNIEHEIIEIEENGTGFLKNAIVKVSFNYAYGLLKYEKGIHRFTRVSPYGNGKLHTSFVFIDVYPAIEFNDNISINKSDLRIDTFRGSGAGGQHRNVTDSAIRLTHKPTGIVVKIENERSQHKNKKMAYDILASKLYEHELNKINNENNNNKGKDSFQDWGSQIRSYTIEQNRIKDHRTNISFNCNFDYYFHELLNKIFNYNSNILFSKEIK